MPYFSLSLKYAICLAYVCLKCWEPSVCSDPSMFQAKSLSCLFLPCELRTTLLCSPLSPSFQYPLNHCDSFSASLVDEVPTNTCKTFTLFSSFSDRYKKPIELAQSHLEFRSEVLNDFIFLLSRQRFKFWKSLKAWPAFLFCVLWPSRLELAALTVIF